jgi:hypothetical protein
MIKAIVSLKNEKTGEFPEVGMTDRNVFSGKSEKIVNNQAKKYAQNREYRVEYFQAERFYSDPFKTLYFGA